MPYTYESIRAQSTSTYDFKSQGCLLAPGFQYALAVLCIKFRYTKSPYYYNNYYYYYYYYYCCDVPDLLQPPKAQ